jgi:hypothetical protein
MLCGEITLTQSFNNIFCVTSPVSVGCSFLDWSIHFLSGKNKFYSTKDSNWIPLSTDPVLEINSHGHKKNHPSGHDCAWQCVDQLATVSDTELLSLYPFPLHLHAGSFSNIVAETQKQIQQYVQDDYAKMINSFIKSNIKVVYVSLNKHNILYTTHPRTLGQLYLSDKFANSLNESSAHLDQLFFSESIAHWEQNGLTDVWDCRERAALCIRPFDTRALMEDLEINRSNQCYQIDARSLWYNGKNTIKKIMHFLNLAIDQTVWSRWVDVYYRWQQIQLDILDFDVNFEYIMNAIVNNWYYEIGDLTFKQEIIIQHCLIYQYGLNLKTWQLKKFPSNTQELYNLLEPNIHLIPEIY